MRKITTLAILMLCLLFGTARAQTWHTTCDYTSMASGSFCYKIMQNAWTNITGDITVSSSGVSAIGAGKVSNTMMASFASGTILANPTGSTAPPSYSQLTAIMDFGLTSTTGRIAIRGSGGWTGVAVSGDATLSSTGVLTLATVPVGKGGTGTSTAFTQGSVVYAGASGTYSQDNSNFFWDDTNHRLGLGAMTAPTTKLTMSNNSGTLPSATLSSALAIMHLAGADGAQPFILMDGFGNSPVLTMRRSAGTMASPSATLTGTNLFGVAGRGYGATGYIDGDRARILFQTTETWTDTQNGTKMLFQTTPTGSATQATAMTVHNSGGISVGTTTDPGIGVISANVGFSAAGSAGVGATKTVRASGGAADCTLIFTGGILTGGTC